MKINLKEWRSTILVLGIILVGSFFLRTVNLASFPIFADESIYIRWAQVMRSEPTLRFLPLSDGKQPLFMWLIIPFLKIFHDPLISGRIVSSLAGLGSTIGIFILTYLLFKSKKSSLVTSLLYAVSPFTLFFDRMALVDSLLSFFAIWSFIFIYLTAKFKRLDTAMISGFLLGAAYLTKSPAILFMILSFSFILFSKKEKAKFVFLNLISISIAMFIYNILRLGPNFHLISSRNLDYVYPISHLWERPLDPFLPYFDRIISWIVLMGPSSIFVLILLSVCLFLKKYTKEIFVLSLWFLFPASVAAMFTKAITARYVLYTIPPLFILSSVVFSKTKSSSVNKIAYLALIITVYVAFKFNFILLTKPLETPLSTGEKDGYLAEWSSGVGIREVATLLKEIRDKNPDKSILVGTEGYFGTLPDGLQVYLEKEPRINVIGVGLNISQVPDSLVASKKAGNLTYLVANSSRLTFEKDFSEYGLKELYSVRKPNRTKNTHEWTANGDYDTFYLLELTQ